MRRLWMLAALTALLSVPCAFAQHRGGSFGGGGAHMGSFSGGASMMSHGGSFAGAPRNNGVTFTTNGNPYHYAHGGYGHGYRRRYYGYGYAYPGYGLYGYDPFLWGSASSYDSSDQYAEQNQQLSQQVNELSNEIARLRDEQEIRAYTPLPTARQTRSQIPPKTSASEATVLVFRDEHREEINNYAVVGRTIWIFNEDRARKVPVTDIDVPATTKVNDDRGVDFSLPR